MQPVSDELLQSLDEESLAKAQQTLSMMDTACTASHAVAAISDIAQHSLADSHAGQEVGDAGEHAVVHHCMSASAIDEGRVDPSNLLHGALLPDAGPMEPVQVNADILLTMKESFSKFIPTPGPTAPVEGRVPSPEALESATDALTQNYTGLTESTHGFHDAEAGTGCSMNVTPPIAAVTPSKAKSNQRVLPGPGVSLSDASMRPAGLSHKPRALASIASTTSVPLVCQDPDREGIHVSRVLIGHQNPLYMSSPGGRSDPCSPPENTNNNHVALNNQLNGHADSELQNKPDCTTMTREHDMTCTQTEAETSEFHTHTSVPCASENSDELGDSPACPLDSVGVGVPVTAVALFTSPGFACGR